MGDRGRLGEDYQDDDGFLIWLDSLKLEFEPNAHQFNELWIHYRLTVMSDCINND